MWQISYPPANGASLGSYFCVKNLTNLKKLSKSGQNKDRQTNSLTPYKGVCGFFSFSLICYLPTRFARRGINFYLFLFQMIWYSNVGLNTGLLSKWRSEYQTTMVPGI